MKIIKKKLHDISVDPNNARKHDQKNIDAIKGSLRKFGQQHPIIINDRGVILAGNGRYEAAKALGWEELACIVTDLERIDQTAFALADNRTAELASWEEEILKATLGELDALDFDLSDIGFDLDEFDLGKPAGGGNTDDDEVPEIPADENPYGVQRGDIWLLGAYYECDACGKTYDYEIGKTMKECSCG